MTKFSNSAYIEQIRRDYAMMLLTERAIPSFADGLKVSGRRIMWTARNDVKAKSAALAGATMAIHPQSTPEGAIDTLAAFYGNNHHLLTGYGDFGTILGPTTYGASRYTSVKISDFAKDVFYVDMDIIPMKPNYDYTQEEPVHFLPLIPMALVNSSSGVAIGFASNILSRKLIDIIDAQIKHLKGVPFNTLVPYYKPYNVTAVPVPNNPVRWKMYGEFKRIDSSSVRIVQVPPGVRHLDLIGTDDNKPGVLDKLLMNDVILDYIDGSTDTFDIVVKFKRGTAKDISDEDMAKMLGLIVYENENLNVVDPAQTAIMSYNDVDLIKDFTNWRLEWYVLRIQRLLDLLQKQIRRLLDVLIAIKHDGGGMSKTMATRKDYIDWLTSIGVNDSEYVSSLPAYRYTTEEKTKLEDQLREAMIQKADYEQTLASEDKRKEIYINELLLIRKKYTK